MENKLGIVCRPGDSKALAGGIREYAEKFFSSKKYQGSMDDLDKFNRKNLSIKVMELFNEIVS